MKVLKKNPGTVLDGTQAYEEFIEIVVIDLEISDCFPQGYPPRCRGLFRGVAGASSLMP